MKKFLFFIIGLFISLTAYCQNVCEHAEKDTVASTCKIKGYVICTICDTKLDTLALLPHDTTKYIIEDATCTHIGYSKVKCNKCNQTLYYCDTIQALGHDTVIFHCENTCHAESRTDITCSRGDLYKMGNIEKSPTMAHKYENDYCTICGLARSEKPESEDSTFLISNARELLWFSEYVYAGNTKTNAKLTADIDLSEVCGENIKKNWLPIGDIDKKQWSFVGEFDGQGHTVSNLYFNNKFITKDTAHYGRSEYDGDDVALFGANSGIVKNVKLKNLSITSVRYVAGVAASNYGIISDCSIDSSTLVTLNEVYIGGICGLNKGKINKCISSASIKGGTNTRVGGIAGYSYDTISHCISFASLTGAGNSYYIGGISGGSSSVILLENCFYAASKGQSYKLAGDGTAGRASCYTSDSQINSTYQFMTKAQVKEGAACYYLNTEVQLSEPMWAQTLGVDEYPHWRTEDPIEKYVYKYFEKPCPNTDEVAKYANCSFDSIPATFAHLVVHPNHINEDEDQEKYDCCGFYTAEYLSLFSQKDFEIKSVEDLMKFCDVVKYGGNKINAILLADIDLSEVCNSKVGSWTPISEYGGIFKGNGHSIENLYIDKSGYDLALFSVVSGEVRDLRVTGSVTAYARCAGICCSCSGVISGCINEVNADGTHWSKDNSYGICGYNKGGVIKNCLNIGKSGQNGIAATCSGVIKNCIEFNSPSSTSYEGVLSYIQNPPRYNVISRDSDLYVLEEDTLSPEMMCLKLINEEIGWGLTDIDGVKTVVPAAFASKLIYPSGLAICPFNKNYSEYSDTIAISVNYRYPNHIDADNDGAYDCCGYHPAFLETYNDGVYEISNAQQMKAFADEVNAGHHIDANVKLMNDIDLSEVCGETLGSWTPIYHFNGKFDGQFHKISGLYINQNGAFPGEWDFNMYECLGLFSGNYGEITRVGIDENCVLKTDSLSIGSICGLDYGLISYCYNEADVVSLGGFAGGVAGAIAGDHQNNVVSCYNTGTISGLQGAGIVGNNFCGYVNNCYNIGEIILEDEGYRYNGISNELECFYVKDSYMLSDTLRDTMFLEYDKSMSVVFSTPLQFSNGEICYALNSTLDSTVWYQKIGVDPYPVLDPTHPKVLYDAEKGVYYNEELADSKEVANESKAAVLTVLVSNREILVAGTEKYRIVDMFGRDVTAKNGNLADGVYIVVANSTVAKAIVK